MSELTFTENAELYTYCSFSGRQNFRLVQIESRRQNKPVSSDGFVSERDENVVKIKDVVNQPFSPFCRMSLKAPFLHSGRKSGLWDKGLGRLFIIL